MKLKYYFTLLSLLSFMACSDDSPSTPDTPDQPDVPNSVEKLVTINAGKTYQTITGFGASDCWNPSYVGKYWTAVTKSPNCSSLPKSRQEAPKVSVSPCGV